MGSKGRNLLLVAEAEQEPERLEWFGEVTACSLRAKVSHKREKFYKSRMDGFLCCAILAGRVAGNCERKLCDNENHVMYANRQGARTHMYSAHTL